MINPARGGLLKNRIPVRIEIKPGGAAGSERAGPHRGGYQKPER
jgi:hypothetical protein